MKVKKAIFFSGNVLKQYDFDEIKQSADIELVAILEKHCAQQLPVSVKKYFSKIYEVTMEPDGEWVKTSLGGYYEANHNETDHIIAQELQGYDPKELRLICASDFDLRLTAKLREKYKIPGVKPTLIEGFKNKLLMKELLQQTTIDVPPFCAIDFSKACDQKTNYFAMLSQLLSVPFIVKPIDSAACMGVVKITSQLEWDSFINTVDHSKPYEAEFFLDGILMQCDLISYQGTFVYAECFESAFPCLDFMSGKNLSAIPLDDEHVLREKIIHFSTEAIKKIGLFDGLYSLELFITPENKLVFLEVAARPSGGLIIDCHKKSYGVNILNIDFYIQTKLPFSIKRTNTQHAFDCLLARPKAGKVKYLKPLQLKSDFDVQWHINVGDEIQEAGSIVEPVASILVWNKDYKALREDFDYLKEYHPVVLED